MPGEKCPTCGKDHDAPFDAEVLALSRKIFEMPPGDARNILVMELVDLYSDDSDWSNLHLPEELHALMEEYLQVKAAMAATGFRLGRYLLRAIGNYEQHKAAQQTTELPSTEAKPKDAGLN